MVEKLNDNVGKKIVEALKMQNSGIKETVVGAEEIKQEVKIEDAELPVSNPVNEFSVSNASVSEIQTGEFENLSATIPTPSFYQTSSVPDIDSVFQNNLNQNLGSVADLQTDYEMPNNVAILNHLILKLPSGVTKQTGAVIIRQTMEALGIPMKSVIQEAQQVQESLAGRARDCQKNIIDLKKQIANLEIKAQQYQRQAVSMNDIINLFINTGA